MKSIDISKLSMTECQGIQINGLGHCKTINCKWQGLSACAGQNIIRTGRNELGFLIGDDGLVSSDRLLPITLN